MDRELLAAAQRGDEAAFVDLIRARSNRLFSIAQRILRDIDRAEDALQDALVIAWRDLRAVRDPVAAAGRRRRRASRRRPHPRRLLSAPSRTWRPRDMRPSSSSAG